jgi:predicted phosphodiesterase
MKKFVSIGDIHGSNRWKLLLFGTVTPTKDLIISIMQSIDKVIFVGDYTDSYETDEPIVENLKEILNFKNDYYDKVILLWGNHDVYYYTMNYGRDNVTGSRDEMLHDLNQIFRQNYRYFQFSYQYKNYIWTHAGIHRGWFEHYVMPKIKGNKESRFREYLNGSESISDILNIMWELQDDSIFMCSHKRTKGGWGRKVGGPLWASREEISTKPIFGYHQIIGHSNLEKIKTVKSFGYSHDDTSVTYVDCLRSWDELYTIDI